MGGVTRPGKLDDCGSGDRRFPMAGSQPGPQTLSLTFGLDSNPRSLPTSCPPRVPRPSASAPQPPGLGLLSAPTLKPRTETHRTADPGSTGGTKAEAYPKGSGGVV